VFERFTDRARRVIVLAQAEARLLDHNNIGTEHLLLGLISEGEGIGAQALRNLDVSLGEVRARVEQTTGRGEGVPTGNIPFTPRAKKVLELALRESHGLGHNYIGTEHILLGLVREGEGVAAQVLTSSGIRLDDVRSTVTALLGGTQPSPPRSVTLRAMLPVEFDEYLGWVVDDYAAELERNGKAVGDAAMDASRASFSSLLPDGVDTPGQVLLIASDPEEGVRVGVLWFGPSTDDPTMAWINDITVDEEERGHGWGRAILRAFEGEARARGFARVGLNVYADNHVARRLYESLGYLETARQLYKDLAGEPDPAPHQGEA
jgi:ribosomal protein S18 acetylase RimI-like enzyme